MPAIDVLVEVMRVDAPVAESNLRWKLGDIIFVREATSELLDVIGGVCPVPRKSYLVIRNWPASVGGIDEIREILEDGGGSTSRRAWMLDFDSFSVAKKAALESSPFYLSQTWGQINAASIKNKSSGQYLGTGDLP